MLGFDCYDQNETLDDEIGCDRKVRVYLCVCVREREREREGDNLITSALTNCFILFCWLLMLVKNMLTKLKLKSSCKTH